MAAEGPDAAVRLPAAPDCIRPRDMPYRDADWYMNGASGRAWSNTLANYELLKQIGKGSYGQVWKGRCVLTGRFVALKLILKVQTSEGFPRTALREIRMLKQLKHANIVNLIDVVIATPDDEAAAKGTAAEAVAAAGSVYLVYEYAEYDFTGLLDGNRLSADSVRAFTYQLLAGLAHLHSDRNRIVHRDIKCSNILLGEGNEVKIADFGLARRMDKAPGRPMSGNVITLWYRPPELLLGAATYDGKVDIWSAGCVLMELITGRTLFNGANEAAQLLKIFKLMGTPPPHSTLRRLSGWRAVQGDIQDSHSRLHSELQSWCRRKQVELPKEAIDVLTHMLDLDPATRYDARRLLAMPWFAAGQAVQAPHTVPFNPRHPTASLPPVSLMAGLDPTLDYHELAARQRRKAEHAAKSGGAGSSKRSDQHSRRGPHGSDREATGGRYDKPSG